MLSMHLVVENQDKGYLHKRTDRKGWWSKPSNEEDHCVLRGGLAGYAHTVSLARLSAGYRN